MREKRSAQVSIYEQFADHALGQELCSMSEWLDAHRAVLAWVMNDLRGVDVKATGRRATARIVGRIGASLCAAQATSAVELRGVGVLSVRLGKLSSVRAFAAQ